MILKLVFHRINLVRTGCSGRLFCFVGVLDITSDTFVLTLMFL
jgi:hypothetical protein